jgi:hypothetical protein
MPNTIPADTNSIPGWGVDADPRNDPVYPMRDRSNEDGPGIVWDRPPLQQSDVEILQSIEHIRRPAVFGTTCPPSGLSGEIRRAAFHYSESQWAHWLLLMLADRINMVEGVLEDFSRGRIPNLWAELGMPAEMKHNRPNLVTKIAVTVIVLVVVSEIVKRQRARLA